MFVKRENNPKQSEWINELFHEGDYSIVHRKESGDYEVYKGKKPLVRTDTYEDAVHYVQDAQGNS